MRTTFAKFVASAALLLMSRDVLGQGDDRYQLIMLSGVHRPVDKEVQNMYGSGPLVQLAVTAPLGERGRLRLTANYFRRDGDPYYQADDFDAGDAGEISLTGVSLNIETRGPTVYNPRLYIGAGLVYLFGTEKVRHLATSRGDGLGVCVSLAPEVRLSQRFSIAAEAGLRLLEVMFQSGKDRYRFNFSGGSLLIGLAVHFGG